MPVRDRLLAVLVAVLWGINFLAIDIALRQFPPLLFVAIRFLVIAIPTVLFVPRPKVKWYWLVGYGLSFGTLQFALLFIAMRIGMPTGLASLLVQASAPFTVLLGAVFLRERLRSRQVVGIGIAMLGMAAILWQRAHAAAALPVLLTLGAALGWALGNLCSRQARPDSPLRLTLWMSVVPPAPMVLLSLAVEGGQADLRSITTLGTATGWAALAALAYIALMSTVLGTGLWTTLLVRYQAATVAPFSLLVPVVGVAAAWLVLVERPRLVELLAGVVVVLGVLVGIPKPAPVSSRTVEPVGVSADV